MVPFDPISKDAKAEVHLELSESGRFDILSMNLAGRLNLWPLEIDGQHSGTRKHRESYVDNTLVGFASLRASPRNMLTKSTNSGLSVLFRGHQDNAGNRSRRICCDCNEFGIDNKPPQDHNNDDIEVACEMVFV